MIQSESYLNVADNSGAKKVMCIKILGNNRKFGKVGDLIIGVVKQVIPGSTIKKSEIVKALIVRTKKKIKRKDGTSLSFSENAAVLLNVEKNPRGTRIFGPIPFELRKMNYLKIVSLASSII